MRTGRAFIREIFGGKDTVVQILLDIIDKLLIMINYYIYI